MSEETDVKLSLENQVAALADRVKQLEERTKDDDETLREFAERINEYGARSEKAVARIEQRVVDALASFGASLYAAFAKDVAAVAVADVVGKIAPETIAESLSKKILVTRPAQRHELADAVVVRPAQKNEK